MADTYYLVSDLHVGGDEQLGVCDFEDEFVSFLRDLAATDEDAELVVLGDAFGLWEFTEVEGPEKFDLLVEQYPAIFEQLRATGETVDVTLMPGNHDYELAAYPEYVERFAEYNVTVEPVETLRRTVDGATVWIEHGMQQDENNRIPDFGNPYAHPLGYFVNRHVTSTAGKVSGRGRYNWLRDLQSLTPMDEIPTWIASNYFYREMSPLLRYAVVPFLLLFNVSVVYLAGSLLEAAGVLGTRIFLDNVVLDRLGVAGNVLNVVITINMVVIVLLALLAVPLWVFGRDVSRTLERFGLRLRPLERGELEDPYDERAMDVFSSHDDVVAYVYGHTHRPSLRRVGGRLVVNTGTWLKRLHRRPAVLGLLPPVYYPSFRLNYFRVTGTEEGVVFEYETVEKDAPRELTLLQRLLTRPPRRTEDVPDRTVVEPRELDTPPGRSPD